MSLLLSLCFVAVIRLSATQLLPVPTVADVCSSTQAQQILSALSRLTEIVSRLETTVSLLQTSNAQLRSDMADMKTTCQLACRGIFRDQYGESNSLVNYGENSADFSFAMYLPENLNHF